MPNDNREKEIEEKIKKVSNNTARELSIDDLDKVSGGELSKDYSWYPYATIITPCAGRKSTDEVSEIVKMFNTNDKVQVYPEVPEFWGYFWAPLYHCFINGANISLPGYPTTMEEYFALHPEIIPGT